MANGQLGPFHWHSWPEYDNEKSGCLCSATVGPKGALNPCGSVSCFHAASNPLFLGGRLKYQGVKPWSSRTFTSVLFSPRGRTLKNLAFGSQSLLSMRVFSFWALLLNVSEILCLDACLAIAAMAIASPYMYELMVARLPWPRCCLPPMESSIPSLSSICQKRPSGSSLVFSHAR